MFKKQKDKFYQLDTRKQFSFVFLCNMGVLLFVIFVMCLAYTFSILNRNDQYISRLVHQYTESIAMQIEEYEQFVQTTAYDDVIYDYLIEEDAYEKHLLSLQVKNLFSSMKVLRPEVEDIYLFLPNDKAHTFTSLHGFEKELVSAAALNTSPKILNAYQKNTPFDQKKSMLYFGTSIQDIYASNTLAPIGIMIVSFNTEKFTERLHELSSIEGVRHAILMQNGTNITGDFPLELVQLEGQNALKNGAPYEFHSFKERLTIAPIEHLKGSLVVQINQIVVLKDLWLIVLLTLTLACLMLLLVNELFKNVRRQITKPLEKIANALEDVHLDENDEHKIPVLGNKDTRLLGTKLNELFCREGHLHNELLETNTHLYQEKLTKKHLELQFLRSQINPHFLYNTLETIRSIALVRGVTEVSSTAKWLAKILRYSIKGSEFVPLKEEISIIECYLNIQNLRFDDRFTFEKQVDETANDVIIPRMCLQPLIENAVVHGLENIVSQGLLVLSAKIKQDALIIQVSDNGVGIEEEKLRMLNEQLQNPFKDTLTENQSIGMMNVARRLQISLGADFTMHVQSIEHKGTSITLSIPLKKEKTV